MPTTTSQQRITPVRVASARGVGLGMLSILSKIIYQFPRGLDFADESV
jgi:hypothetical protein